jgi:hypothetical protein
MFLGANRNFSASIGSFQRLRAELEEVVLFAQRLALTYSTTFKGLWQAFFQSFSPFFFICIQQPVFRFKPTGFWLYFLTLSYLYNSTQKHPASRS